MNLIEQFSFLRKNMETQAAYHKRQLSRYPSGKLAFAKNVDYMRWYHREDNATRGGARLYRKDKFIAKQLAMKKYHQEMSAALEEQIHLLDQFIQLASAVITKSEMYPAISELAGVAASAMTISIQYANERVPGYRNFARNTENPPGSNRADRNALQQENRNQQSQVNRKARTPTEKRVSVPINKSEEYRKLIVPPCLEAGKWLTDWCSKPYRCSSYRLEELTVQAKCGLWVRSKSEAFIADMLYALRIPFHYEEVLAINGCEFCPDFTILLGPGKVVYWEHFGALGRSGYLMDTQKKMHNYLDCGIYPGRDLFITCESADRPLDLREVEEKLLILCGRYMSAVPFSTTGDSPLL